MACRIQSIVPDCGYNVEGIDQVLLLDFDDLDRVEFDSDDLYDNCKITAILRSGDFVEIGAPDDGAKYTSAISGGLYAHTLETFITSLSAFTLSNLHLALNRRYLVVFHTLMGQYFAFGYEAGSLLSYANQTSETTGSLVTINSSSAYPLFEVDVAALDEDTNNYYTIKSIPDFDTNAYCLKTTGNNAHNTGARQATVAYNVTDPGGEPVDIYGIPIDLSELPQAILLLTGKVNPNPSLYAVAGYFNVGDYVTGNSTQIYSPDSCPVGFLRLSATMLVLSPTTTSGTFTLTSANPWQLYSSPSISVTTSPVAGATGVYTITATRSGGTGQGNFVYRDTITNETATIYIVNTTTPTGWILSTGTWDYLAFWQDAGIWNY